MINFNATPSLLGYEYQKMCALKLLVDSIETREISLTLEKIDDIFIEGLDKNISVQTKHSGIQNKNLTERSSDFWKTMRVWSTQVKNGVIKSDECFFVLITTADLGLGSPLCDFCKENRNFDLNEKLDYIKKLANETPGKSKEKRCEDFLTLSEIDQYSIIKNLYIFWSSDDIETVSQKIKSKLKHSVDDQYVENVYHQLCGWWKERTEVHLLDETKKDIITTREVRTKKREISEEYWCDNLPIDYSNLTEEQIENTLELESEMVFIKQLELVGFKEAVKSRAKRDYCRAHLQRRKWLIDQEIFDDELNRYDEKLKDAWEENFTFMCDKLDSSCNIVDISNEGQELYQMTRQFRPELKIRERCNESYIQRGSYEKLSDLLKVGWHKDYDKILEVIKK